MKRKSETKPESKATTKKRKKEPWPTCDTTGCKRPSVLFYRVFDKEENEKKVHTCHQHYQDSKSQHRPKRSIKRKVKVDA